MMMRFVAEVSNSHAREPITPLLHSALTEREQDQIVAALKAIQ